MPEILNGKNVADFIDPEIDERLAELEREEEELEAKFAEEQAAAEMEAEPDLDEEDKQTLRAVRARRAELITEHRRKKSAGNNAPTLPRTVSASHADPKKRDGEAHEGVPGGDGPGPERRRRARKGTVADARGAQATSIRTPP